MPRLFRNAALRAAIVLIAASSLAGCKTLVEGVGLKITDLE